MSNVVPLRPCASPASDAGRTDLSIADDLFRVLDALQAVAARAAGLDRPAIEIERAVQNLLDAVGAVEEAIGCIGAGTGPG